MAQLKLSCNIKLQPSLIAHTVLLRNDFAANLNAANLKRQIEFLSGRITAAYALKQLSANNLVVDRQNDLPKWPLDFCGSISHKSNLAYVAAAHKQNWQSLGLDIEYLFKEQQAQSLVAKVFTDFERANLPVNAFNVTLVFSLKEALFKALHPLTLTKFYWCDAKVMRLTKNSAKLKLLKNLSNEFKAGFIFEAKFSVKDNLLVTMLAI